MRHMLPEAIAMSDDLKKKLNNADKTISVMDKSGQGANMMQMQTTL